MLVRSLGAPAVRGAEMWTHAAGLYGSHVTVESAVKTKGKAVEWIHLRCPSNVLVSSPCVWVDP
jgi:hypothetical protein